MLLFVFTARRNARIASAVLATAIPSVRPSVRHTPVLCQNDCMLHGAVCTVRQQNVSSFVDTKHFPQGRPLPPEILVQTDLPLPDNSES